MGNPQQEKNNRYLVTSEGYSKLKDQIEKLQKKISETGLEKGEAAGSGAGQWHDNPAYEELEQEERRLLNKLAELKEKLASAQIIDSITDQAGFVSIGSIVTIRFIATSESITYTITDPELSDPDAGKISYQSPLGSVLMEKKVGDIVDFRGQKIEILKIE